MPASPLTSRISTHRGVVSATARQTSSASTSAAQLLVSQPAYRGQHAWRCLRASVAAKERECKALKEKIEAIEKRLDRERPTLGLADGSPAQAVRQT